MEPTKRSHNQTKRLGIEKRLLDKYFPGRIVWIDPTDANKTKVEIALNTNDGTEFVLRIYLPSDFPYSCPVLVVTSPRLSLRNGQRFPNSSSDFHTLEDVDGYPCICHFQRNCWTQENTLCQVVMKGRLWLEAYRLYHTTGEPMNKFLKEFVIDPTPMASPDVPRERSRTKTGSWLDRFKRRR